MFKDETSNDFAEYGI